MEHNFNEQESSFPTIQSIPGWEVSEIADMGDMADSTVRIVTLNDEAKTQVVGKTYDKLVEKCDNNKEWVRHVLTEYYADTEKVTEYCKSHPEEFKFIWKVPETNQEFNVVVEFLPQGALLFDDEGMPQAVGQKFIEGMNGQDIQRHTIYGQEIKRAGKIVAPPVNLGDDPMWSLYPFFKTINEKINCITGHDIRSQLANLDDSGAGKLSITPPNIIFKFTPEDPKKLTMYCTDLADSLGRTYGYSQEDFN